MAERTSRAMPPRERKRLSHDAYKAARDLTRRVESAKRSSPAIAELWAKLRPTAEEALAATRELNTAAQESARLHEQARSQLTPESGQTLRSRPAASEQQRSPRSEPAHLAGEPRAELTVGCTDAREVTVKKIRLTSEVRQVVIRDSDGGQIGDRNRQLNDFHYTISRSQVSLHDALHGSPLRNLETLAANPDDARANERFRRSLPTDSGSVGGRVRFAQPHHRSTVRIAARVDGAGAVVVEGSRGFHIGDGNVQRNRFEYKLEGSRVRLGTVLKDRADLARDFALAMRYPGNKAVSRSLESRMAGVRGDLGGRVGFKNLDLPGGPALAVGYGAGVQLGSGNRRADALQVSLAGVQVDGRLDAAAKRVSRAVDRQAPTSYQSQNRS